MTCIYCGADTGSEQNICRDCAQNPRVTVLAPEERENFQGLTIDQSTGRAGHEQSQVPGSNPHVYVRQFSLGHIRGGFLLKLLIGAVFLLLISVALPVSLVFLAFIIMNWILTRRHPDS
jgi:hypothetical protein